MLSGVGIQFNQLFLAITMTESPPAYETVVSQPQFGQPQFGQPQYSQSTNTPQLYTTQQYPTTQNAAQYGAQQPNLQNPQLYFAPQFTTTVSSQIDRYIEVQEEVQEEVHGRYMELTIAQKHCITFTFFLVFVFGGMMVLLVKELIDIIEDVRLLAHNKSLWRDIPKFELAHIRI